MAWKEEIRKDRMGNIVYEKYSLRVGKLYLSVVRGHINWPDKWVGNCPPR